MTASIEMNRVFQQVGELVGSVRALHEKIDLRHATAEKMTDQLQSDLRSTKRDVNELEHKHDTAVHVLTDDIAAIRRAQDELQTAVDGLRKPLDEIIALRTRAMGALVVIGPLCAGVAYFLPAFWRGGLRMLEIWLRLGAS